MGIKVYHFSIIKVKRIAPEIMEIVSRAKGLDDFLFKLKLEGYELRDGEPKYDLPYRRW